MPLPVSASRSVARLSIQQAQHLALPSLFVLFGLIMGSWAGRIPALAEQAHLSHSALSRVLLCGGLGAILSFPLSSWLMASFGGRKTLLYAGLALLCVLMGIGLAPTVPLLMVAVLLLGVTASCFDVGMNAVAARQEKHSGKSKMSTLHGLACAGGLAGTLLGSLMASLTIPPSTHFVMLAGPLAVLLWAGYQLLEADGGGEKVDKKSFALPRGPLALLGLLGFFAAMSEGSIADWSGVFLKEHFQATDGFAPLAVSAFSAMMLVARLNGDRFKRLGARRLVCGGALLSAAGLCFAALAPTASFALAGFALSGLGLALVFPFVFSAAGAQGPVALAGVATLAYSGSLIGPPVLGAIAHGAGMQAAMGFIGVISVVIAIVAGKTAMLK